MPKIVPPILTTSAGFASLPPETQAAYRALEAFGQQTKVLNKALVIGDTLQIWTAQTNPALKVTVPDNWQVVTLTSGTTNFGSFYSPAAAMKDQNGKVTVRGTVKRATAAAAIILPAPLTSWAPTYNTLLSSWGDDGAAKAMRIHVIGVANGSNIGEVQFSGAAPVNFGSIECSFQSNDSSPYVPSCFPIDLPLNLGAPSFVLVSAVECNNAGDPLATPSNLSIMNADWIVVQVSSTARILRIRNIPGLSPLRTYAVSICAFAGS